MTDCQLVKTDDGVLRPAYGSDAEMLAKIQPGSVLLADVRKPRNPLFHRKFFALLNFAFGYWEPEIKMDPKTSVILRNYQVGKNFDRFRKDVLILAGFRYPVVNVKNEVRWEAESISFSSMDDTQFEKVYSEVFNVLWRMVLSKVQGMTQQDVDNAVNNLLAYE